MRLEGKVALVTGGASGIGKATVLAFAQAGARVIAADIDLERGSAVARAAEQEGLAVEFVSIDLSASDSIRACAAAVLERHPRLDILVNAAGFSIVEAFAANKPGYIDQVVAINLGGTLHLTQALLPGMIAAGRGKIVNVASDAGRVGSSGETAYAAAKGGVIAFTKSLAREVARHSINLAYPVITHTPHM